MHRQRRAILFLLLPLAASCADDEAAPTMVERAPRAAVAPLPGASVSVPVRVPARMRTAPFDVERRLNVPPGFAIEVYARIPGVRFLHVLPDNNILASIPSAGKVVLIRPGANGADATVTDWATGLRNPHDIVTTILGRTLNVYVAESHQIIRFPYSLPEGVQGPKTVVVANLPDNSSPELRGRYGHQLKNIAIRDNNLFVSIASPSNADPADVTRTPKGRRSTYTTSTAATGGCTRRGCATPKDWRSPSAPTRTCGWWSTTATTSPIPSTTTGTATEATTTAR